MSLKKASIKIDRPVLEIIEKAYSVAESPSRKKKENLDHVGATIWHTDTKRIEMVMKMMGTTNKSEAVRFLIEAAWAAVGDEVENQARKRRHIPVKDMKIHIPPYYKTNFNKILERVNAKVLGDIVEQIYQEDKEAGILDNVVILNVEKIDKMVRQRVDLKKVKRNLHNLSLRIDKKSLENEKHITDHLFDEEKIDEDVDHPRVKYLGKN